MEKIKYYIEKYRLLIILMIVILFLVLCLIFSLKSKSSTKIEKTDDLKVENKEEVIEPEKIKVDIKGLIATPGVYEMDTNNRVIDVINKAGGLTEGANTEYINLSKKLVDEMVIVIYSNEDVEKFKETDKEIIYKEYECVCPDNINTACITTEDTINTNGVKEQTNNELDSTTNSTNVESNGKISINSGSLEELMSLDGVGESKAKSIIEYREQNGGFKALEDLMNVSGIGEKAYSKIKDNIKL